MSIGIGSSYDESGWSDCSERRDGYNQAIKDVTEHVLKMRTHYTDCTMCSISESIIGETVCDGVLRYLKQQVQK